MDEIQIEKTFNDIGEYQKDLNEFLAEINDQAAELYRRMSALYGAINEVREEIKILKEQKVTEYYVDRKFELIEKSISVIVDKIKNSRDE